MALAVPGQGWDKYEILVPVYCFRASSKEAYNKIESTRERQLFSWKGLEKYRERLHDLLYEIQENEKAVKRIAKLHGWDVTGLISSTICDPSSVSYCK